MKRKITKKKETESDILDWRRTYKILPVDTKDGYRVWCQFVWRRTVWKDLNLTVEFHTNPNGRENKFKKKAGDSFFSVGFDPRKIAPPDGGRGNRPPPPPPPPKPKCSKCGTYDCYKGPAKFSISGAGVLSAKSADIMKSCKARQQVNALGRIKMGSPKKLPKNQKLGYYTGGTGPG